MDYSEFEGNYMQIMKYLKFFQSVYTRILELQCLNFIDLCFMVQQHLLNYVVEYFLFYFYTRNSQDFLTQCYTSSQKF